MLLIDVQGSTFVQSIFELSSELFLLGSSSGSASPFLMEDDADGKPARSIWPSYASPTPAAIRKLLPPSVQQTIPNLAKQYPLRVLLAEDNMINVKMLVMLMRKLGYEILVAMHGADALQLLEREAARGREHEIECILMDASMDVMDGFECTRVIRGQQMPHRVRPFIIAQTANVTDDYRERCKESGMDLFLAKPIQLQRLTASLQAAHAAQHPPGASTLSSAHQ